MPEPRLQDLQFGGSQKSDHNLRVLDEYAAQSHFERWIGQGAFYPDGTAARAIINTRYAVIAFPDATSSFAYAEIAVPARWTNGFIGLDVYSSFDGAGSGDVFVRAAAKAVAAGESVNQGLPTPGFLAIPAPGVANGLVVTRYAVDSMVCDSSKKLLTVRLDRSGANAADTYVGVWHLHGVLVTFTPKTPTT